MKNLMKKKTIFAVSAILLIFLMGISLSVCLDKRTDKGSAESKKGSYRHVDLDEAKKLIRSGEGILIDVRSAALFSFEHIPGAINIPYETITDDSKEAIPELPNKNKLLILYCDYGGISKEIAEKLVDKGYTNVVEFDGLLVWDEKLAGSEHEST